MAVQVQRPAKKSSGLSDLLTIGGGIVGASTGAGGFQGAATGAALGSTAGGLLEKQGAGGGGGGLAAAQRKIEPQTVAAPQTADPLQAVQQAQIAVANLPPEQQREFAPALRVGAAVLRRKQEGSA